MIYKYMFTSWLKCKISVIWLIKTACTSPIFLSTNVQISIEYDTQDGI